MLFDVGNKVRTKTGNVAGVVTKAVFGTDTNFTGAYHVSLETGQVMVMYEAELVPEAARVVGETINHPAHYGGMSNPYEAIKVIEAWGLGFSIGNAVKYIARAGRKTPDQLEDLKKARWYLSREIEQLEAREHLKGTINA